MSQSDYLKYKRVATELKINKLDPIFKPEDYVSYKEFSLENQIVNTKLRYNQLVLPNKKIIFDIEKTTLSCPTFITCNNTNMRTNRKLLLKPQMSVNPLRPLLQKDIDKKLINLNLCVCSKI